MNNNQLKKIIVNLTIIFALFISSPSWAGEKRSFDENKVFDDKLIHADNIRSSKPKLFLVLVNELNQHANNISDSQKYHLDYLNLYLLIYQGNLTEAISSSKKLINSDADILLKFRAKLSLVNIFAISQNWNEGLSTLSSLLKELPLIKHEHTQHKALLVAALFYNQLGQYDLSLSYAKKVELSSKQGRDQCLAKSYIIKSSFKLKQLTPTNPIIRHAISLCRINKEHLYISLINFNLAEKHIENKEQDKALHILNSTLQDALDTKYPLIITSYYSLLAHAHWLNNDKDLTQKFALQALENETQEGTTASKVLSYKLLFEVFKAQENYELALLYHQKYAHADKQFYNETQAKNLAFQLAAHKAIEQQGQIDLLSKQNDLLTTEKALTRTNTNNTRLIIMVLALTLVVLTFWGYRLLLAHKRIKQLAEYDALTGAYNRGHFTQVATSAVAFCKNANQELSVIMFDLDHFKQVNDSYGHACGDWALRKTVETCKRIGRQNDVFARLGGEEFCLLLTSCDSEAALSRAEACRKAIEKINTAESGFDFTITASFGVSSTKTSDYDLDKLLADADSAAYASKHAGRNRVTPFKPEKTDSKNVVFLDDSRNIF
jgi:diguanylate cyclase (GGDEF)-like protein